MTKKIVEHCKETVVCDILSRGDGTIKELRACLDELAQKYGEDVKFYGHFCDCGGIQTALVRVMEEETDFEYEARLKVEEFRRQQHMQQLEAAAKAHAKKEAEEKRLYEKLHKKYGKKA